MNPDNTIKRTSPYRQVRPRLGHQQLWQSVLSFGVLLTLLTSCALPQQVTAEERMFLQFSLDFLGEYSLPETREFQNHSIRHLSAITYEIPGYSDSTPEGIHFYALGEETEENLAQFYTLNFEIISEQNTTLKQVSLENITPLKDQFGQPLINTKTHPESLAFSPRNSLFIATENQVDGQKLPFIGEYDLKTGKLRNTVPIPPSYLPTREDEKQQQGIPAHSGFKAMSIAPDGFSPGGQDPFRLFTSTEVPLIQDRDEKIATKLRILHYVIADRASFLVSENLYPLEAEETSPNQLVDLVALNQGGYFLSLERSANTSQIYQVFTGDATDTSRIASLRGELPKVQPMRKKLLLDLNQLNRPLHRPTSMTLGPRLPSGNPSLLIISEDNSQTPQFLLFSLKQT